MRYQISKKTRLLSFYYQITLMGNRIWAVDMILNDMMKPMFQAYAFNQYKVCAQLLWQLNCFLKGYGTGVDGMGAPDLEDDSAITLASQDGYFQNYYELYCPLTMVAMGKFIKDVLESVIEENQG